jgi:hypothetical protein
MNRTSLRAPGTPVKDERDDRSVNVLSEECDDGGESTTCDLDCKPAVYCDGRVNAAARRAVRSARELGRAWILDLPTADEEGEGGAMLRAIGAHDEAIGQRSERLADEGGWHVR